MKKSHLLSLGILLILTVVMMISQTPSLAESIFDSQSDQSVYLPITMKLYKNQHTVQGIVIDARTKVPVGDAEVCLKDTQFCDQSNNDGEYVLTKVPSGHHTITVQHSEYPLFTEELTVPRDTFQPYIIHLMPVLNEGQFRVILTWDSTPKWGDWPNNLELHLWMRDQGDYHIHEGNKLNCENDLEVHPYACYETDAQFGSGPDTIVFLEIPGDEYTFAVLNYFYGYEGVPPLTELDVVVEVYDASGLMESFSIDDVQGDTGDLWYVFDLWNGNIDDQHCLQQYKLDESPPTDCP
jgi:hypothetical protein